MLRRYGTSAPGGSSSCARSQTGKDPNEDRDGCNHEYECLTFVAQPLERVHIGLMGEVSGGHHMPPKYEERRVTKLEG